MERSDYERIFESTMSKAQKVFYPALLARLSKPQPLILTEAYWKSPLRVMVMGRETLNSDDGMPLSAYNPSDTSAFRAFMENELEEFHQFDFGYENKRSLFWKAYQQVCDVLGLRDRRSTAWTNISKVQLIRTHECDRASISSKSISPEDRMSIIRWQTALSRAEIAYAKPHLLIMFTGDMTWIADHYFTVDSEGKPTSSVERLPIADLPEAQTAEIKAPLLEGTRAFFTYHPNARNPGRERVDLLRAAMLNWVRDQMAPAKQL